MKDLENRRGNGKSVEDKDPDSEDDICDNWDGTKVSEESDDLDDLEFFNDIATSRDGLDHQDGDEEEGVDTHSYQPIRGPPPGPRRSGMKRLLVPYDLLMNSSSDEKEVKDDIYHPSKKAKKRRINEGVEEVENLNSELSEKSSGLSTRNSSPDDTPPEIEEEKKGDDLPESEVHDQDVLIFSDKEKEKVDYFPIRILPPDTFWLPKNPTPPIVSPEILDGQPRLNALAPSESPEVAPPGSEEPEVPEEYYKVIDPQQIISVNKFRRAYLPRFSLVHEDENEKKFIMKKFFEPTPPSPIKALETTEQLDEQEQVYWQEADDPPEMLERETFRFIRITTRKRPLGKVVLTMQETIDSPITVQLLEDHVAFGKVLDVASYFLIEKLVLEMLKVNNEKYISYLSETIELLPIRYLDWWNYKPLNTPYKYSGCQLNRFLKRCDPRFLKKLKVRFDRWNFETLRDAINASSHWRNLSEFETNMPLPTALQRCLHFNNFKIKVHELDICEWEPLFKAFRMKLTLCPPPSFDIQTETDIFLTPFNDKDPYHDFPLYTYADMFTSSLHILLVKIEKNRVSGRVIEKVEVEKLPEIVERVFSDDFNKGYCE